jgi:hypothetical protein
MKKELEQHKINEIVCQSLGLEKASQEQTLGELGAERTDFLDIIYKMGIGYLFYASGGELNKEGKQKFRELGNYAGKKGINESKDLFNLIADKGIENLFSNLRISDLKLIQNYDVKNPGQNGNKNI